MEVIELEIWNFSRSVSVWWSGIIKLAMDGVKCKTQWQAHSFSLTFLVACTRLYKTLCLSVGRSVGLSVDLSHFTFFAFLSYLKVEKCRIKYPMSVKHQFWSFSVPFGLIFYGLVGLSACPTFHFFAVLSISDIKKHKSKCLDYPWTFLRCVEVFL